MSGDYFDVLLARMSGELPAVEPRIAPFVPAAAVVEDLEEPAEPAVAVRLPDSPEPSTTDEPMLARDEANRFAPKIVVDAPERVELRTERVVERAVPAIHHHSEAAPVERSVVVEPADLGSPASEPVRAVPPPLVAQPLTVRAQPRASGLQTPAHAPEPVVKRTQSETREAELPPISVRIERIEVRTTPPVKPERRPQQPSAGPRLTLDDYLKRRNGGGW